MQLGASAWTAWARSKGAGRPATEPGKPAGAGEPRVRCPARANRRCAPCTCHLENKSPGRAAARSGPHGPKKTKPGKPGPWKSRKATREGGPCSSREIARRRSSAVSALTSFETTLGLVDHVDAALPAHDAAVAVALFERAERVCDLHLGLSSYRGARAPVVEVWLRFREAGEGHGGRYWDRTSGPYDVNVVLYR